MAIIRNPRKVAVDTETTGLKWFKDHIIMAQWYINEQDNGWVGWGDKAIEKVKGYLTDEKTLVIMHNAKFDMLFLASHGLGAEIQQALDEDRIRCTHMRAFILDHNEHSFSLGYLAEKYLNASKEEGLYEELAKIFGGRATRGVQMKNMQKFYDLDSHTQKRLKEVIGSYGIQDGRLTLGLYGIQEKRLKEEGLDKYEEFERRVLDVTYRTQRAGVRVDIDKAKANLKRASKKYADIEKLIKEKISPEFNINSTPQMRTLFDPSVAEDLKTWTCQLSNGQNYTSDKITKTGNPSLDAKILTVMAEQGDDRARLVVDARRTLKLKDTFLQGHIIHSSVFNKATGDWRVYPNINQFASDEGGTVTNRFSYSDPALQQIPKRDPYAMELTRECFMPDKGHAWFTGDLEQHEFRVFAHYLNNDKITQTFNDDEMTDFHQMVADLTGLPRSRTADSPISAKEVDLGLVFGMGKATLAKHLGYEVKEKEGHGGRMIRIVPDEVERVWDTFGKEVEGVFDLPKKIIASARQRGFVFSMLGRKIRPGTGLPIHKVPQYLYQGSSADLNKANVLICDELCRKVGGRLVLNIHDDYNIQLPLDMKPSKVAEFLEDLKHQITWKRKDDEDNNLYCRIPTSIDFGQGRTNWFEASKAPLVTGQTKIPLGGQEV